MDTQLNINKHTNQASFASEKRKGHRTFKDSFDLSDIGNGKRFAALFGHYMRYDDVLQAWRVHRDGVWKVDETGETERCAKEVSLIVAAEAANTTDDDKRGRLLKHATLLTRRSVREIMLKDASSEWGMRVTPEMLDTHPELLNCKNGTLDLQTWEFGPHQAEDFLTLQTSIAFDPHAECLTWLTAMRQWHPDESVRDYLQDCAGLSLTGKIYEEFFNLLIGPGDNGKSTFLRMLEKVAHDYWTKTEAETLMKSRDGRRAEAPAPSLLALKGARIVTVHELDEKHEINAPLVKDLTGRDAITARGIHEKRPTTFLPQFTLWAFGNSKPKVTDTSNGMWRRVRIIDFSRVIPKEQRDPNLSTKLEAELPGILNWALEGLKRVQKRGLIVPEAVNAATTAYHGDQDPLTGFINSRCVVSPNAFIPAADLWSAWTIYCHAHEKQEGKQIAFGTALKNKKLEDTRQYINGVQTRIWKGIRLKSEEEQDTQDE